MPKVSIAGGGNARVAAGPFYYFRRISIRKASKHRSFGLFIPSRHVWLTGVLLMTKPVPARGRPAERASERSRNRVALLAALGWPGRRIANAVGLDPKTLHAHYAAELDRDAAYNRISGMLMTRLLDLFFDDEQHSCGSRIARPPRTCRATSRADRADDEAGRQKRSSARGGARARRHNRDWGGLMIRREARQRADGEPPN